MNLNTSKEDTSLRTDIYEQSKVEFTEFFKDKDNLQPHVLSALASLSASTTDAASISSGLFTDNVGTDEFTESLVANLTAVSADDFSVLRRRQAALLECFIKFHRLTERSYDELDISHHIVLADALQRYVNAWVRFYARRSQRYSSNADLEDINASLGDVLAVFSVGYGFRMNFVDNNSSTAFTDDNLSLPSTSLMNVLRSIGRGARSVPTHKLQNFGRGLRVLISSYLQITLSNIVFFAWTGLEIYDKNAPLLDRASIVGSIILRGPTAEPNMAQFLFMGYPERSFTLGFIPTVVARRGLVLQSFIDVRTTILALVATAAHYLIVVPTSFVSGGVANTMANIVTMALSVAVWQVVVLLTGYRLLKIVPQLGEIQRRAEARIEGEERWSRALTYIERQINAQNLQNPAEQQNSNAELVHDTTETVDSGDVLKFTDSFHDPLGFNVPSSAGKWIGRPSTVASAMNYVLEQDKLWKPQPMYDFSSQYKDIREYSKGFSKALENLAKLKKQFLILGINNTTYIKNTDLFNNQGPKFVFLVNTNFSLSRDAPVIIPSKGTGTLFEKKATQWKIVKRSNLPPYYEHATVPGVKLVFARAPLPTGTKILNKGGKILYKQTTNGLVFLMHLIRPDARSGDAVNTFNKSGPLPSAPGDGIRKPRRRIAPTPAQRRINPTTVCTPARPYVFKVFHHVFTPTTLVHLRAAYAKARSLIIPGVTRTLADGSIIERNGRYDIRLDIKKPVELHEDIHVFVHRDRRTLNPRASLSLEIRGIVAPAHSPDQPWHADYAETGSGAPRYATLLVALEDMSGDDQGPTEFILGGIASDGMLTRDQAFPVPETTRKPLLGANAGVIFDGRIIHRGTATQSTERPSVVYMTYSVTPDPNTNEKIGETRERTLKIENLSAEERLNRMRKILENN